jgi:hypothetical protein
MEEPVLVEELGSNVTECSVMPDLRTIYLYTDHPDNLGGHDIYSAERADLDSSFGEVVHHPEISTSSAEARLSTGDLLHAFFWSTRPGGVGNSDIWEVTRASPIDPFTNDNAVSLTAINTERDEYDPWSSRDGLRVYFTSVDRPIGVGGQDIYVAERELVTGSFGEPTLLEGLSSASSDDNPTLSSDERFIVFSSSRPQGLGSFDLYYSRRADRASPFAPPQPLPILNTSFADWEPCMTDAGELFFTSDRTGVRLLYRSRFVPL